MTGAAGTEQGFYERLDALYAAGDLMAVESFLRDEAKRPLGAGESPLDRVPALNQLACHLRNASRLGEALPVFDRTLQVLREEGMGGTPQYAIVLLNRAGLDRLRGARTEAIEAFQEAATILADAGDSYAYEHVGALNNLSLALHDDGQVFRALDVARQAMGRIAQLPGHDAELATSQGNVAHLLLAAGDAPAALELARASAQWYEGQGDLGTHYASALEAQGRALRALGERASALACLERARDALLRCAGRTLDYAAVMGEMAALLEDLGRDGEADAARAERDAVMSNVREGLS
ncbi:tetratricopeptide repeat protein [Olsenella massiliensis]|uniref:tetratricopeptide repeat protein n=1 Tax=Olsenella massiliensis TaxID=1622075 RepID=UPI00071DB80D|nr:tetratricopeptide repeat protein [Olsenella massiliensis]